MGESGTVRDPTHTRNREAPAWVYFYFSKRQPCGTTYRLGLGCALHPIIMGSGRVGRQHQIRPITRHSSPLAAGSMPVTPSSGVTILRLPGDCCSVAPPSPPATLIRDTR